MKSGTHQRLLFLAASAVMLAVCWKAAPGETGPVYPPVSQEQERPAPAVQMPAEKAAPSLPEDSLAWDTPFYTYYDEAGELQLELYFDPESGRGRGTRYDWNGPDGRRKVPEPWTFAFDAVSPDEAWPWLGVWQEPYAVQSVWGTDGAEAAADYQETWEYDSAGKPVRVCAQGVIDDPHFEGPARLLELAWFYREDGTLCRKSYYHESWLFGTTYASAEAYYDELERPVFVRGYITHGTLEFYYLYTGESQQPDYGLCLDFNGGYGPYTELHPYA